MRRMWSSRVGTVAHPYPLRGEFMQRTVFEPDFQGHFGGLPILKIVIQHTVGKPQMSTFQWYKVCSNRSSDGKVMAPGSWVSELFFCVFPVKIPAKPGKLPVNRELRLVAGVAVFPTHPGSWINSQRAGRNSRAKAVVREEKRVRFSARFPYFCLCSRTRLT